MKLATIIVLLVASILTSTARSYDHYLLSCGASVSVANKISEPTWHSDQNSTFSTNFFSTIPVSTTSLANIGEPYSTARVFTSNLTYSFPVSSGPKFIRLYFYPSQSNYTSQSPTLSLSAADTYLTVQANSDHILLRNFSAYLNSDKSNYFVREFYINVNGSHLQLTFSPTPPSSYAFVNGIEVVSVPDNLYVTQTPPKNLEVSGIEFDLSAADALETVYRLNVGGTDISLNEDSGRMNRQWLSDDSYVIGFSGLSGFYDRKKPIKYTRVPESSAPVDVYKTFRSMGSGRYSNEELMKLNVTWEFEVDLGFFYLLRLLWCEVVIDINGTNFRVFDVYIHGRVAEKGADVFQWAGGYTAYYKDYVVYMDGGAGKGNLQLAMHPNMDSHPIYDEILLNGLEIFKISKQEDGSLYAPNPSPLPVAPPIHQTPPQSSSSHILPAIIGAVFGAFILTILLFCLFIIRRRKLSKKSAESYETGSSKSKRFLRSGKFDTTKRSGGGSSSLPSHLCQYFSLEEIKLATSDFSDSLIIGHGGFGNVYKGTVNTGSGPTTVAIKRLNPLSNQGAREFAMEIQLLSKLRHLHLVSLIGYCDAAGEMILIYEYMSHGTLRDHLFPHNIHPNAQLPWSRRLEICAGAARGLHYLHTGTERMVIHRDVKSTNILLDERWVAKVSDFGLSKLGPAGDDLVSHVSTVVKGSFGYVDPEYYRRQQLTEKSDVYSFGVVLFEVLCGRAAVNPNLPKEQVNLRIWARRNQLSGTLDTIVDPVIKGQISSECLRKFGDVAESCVRDEGVLRPSMVDVIAGLELAIQIQSVAFVPKSVDQVLSGTMTTTTTNGTDQVDDDLQFPTTSPTSPTTDTSVRLIKSAGESTWTSMNNSSTSFSNSASEPYGGSTDVFSQIFKADGR